MLVGDTEEREQTGNTQEIQEMLSELPVKLPLKRVIDHYNRDNSRSRATVETNLQDVTRRVSRIEAQLTDLLQKEYMQSNLVFHHTAHQSYSSIKKKEHSIYVSIIEPSTKLPLKIVIELMN